MCRSRGTMCSSRRATRRGIVHVIDAFLAATLILSLTLLSVYVMFSRLNTQVQQLPDPSGVDKFIRSNLESGRWQYYMAQGRADRIAEEIKDYLRTTMPGARVQVIIYGVNPSSGAIGNPIIGGDTLVEAKISLRYFVPAGGWLGGATFILEVGIYW